MLQTLMIISDISKMSHFRIVPTRNGHINVLHFNTYIPGLVSCSNIQGFIGSCMHFLPYQFARAILIYVFTDRFNKRFSHYRKYFLAGTINYILKHFNITIFCLTLVQLTYFILGLHVTLQHINP